MIGDVVFYPNYIHYAGFAAASEPSETLQNYACSGGETSGGLYDLVDLKRSTLVTYDTNGESDDIITDLDLSANITSADFSIIDNHNFTTAGANVQIAESSSVKNITAYEASGLGVASAASTINSSQIVDTAVDGILLINITTPVTGDDWQIQIEEDGATFTADVTIGEWVIGKKCTPSVAPDQNIVETHRNEGIIVERARGGQKYGFENFGYRRMWRMSWKHLTDTDKSNIESVWQVTEGSKYPFYFDSGENSTPTLYLVRFAQDTLDFRKNSSSSYSLTLTLESEV